MDRLRAKHKADRKDRTVAATSIIAKTERERLIAHLKQTLGVNFGCGYAHDNMTRAFVKNCPPDAHDVRWTWKLSAPLSNRN